MSGMNRQKLMKIVKGAIEIAEASCTQEVPQTGSVAINHKYIPAIAAALVSKALDETNSGQVMDALIEASVTD